VGNWSCDIMGGDTELDAKADIFDICKVDYFKGTMTPNALNEYSTKLLEMVTNCGSRATMVYGFMILQYGATLYLDAKSAILGAIQEELNDLQTWNDPDKRKFYLEQFKNTIEHYDGLRVTLPQKGLFETISEKL
jgi:hypothetical protein